MFTIQNYKNFKNVGYFTKKNYLEKTFKKKLHESFDKMSFKKVSQVRKFHYRHIFKSDYPNLPSKNEAFRAKFSVAKKPRKNQLFEQFWKNFIIPDLKKLTNNKAKYFLFPNIYKLKKGDVFRCHVDDYAGICGFTFYLNKYWRWDYGGILNLVFKDGSTDQIFPHSNSIMFRNEKKKLFHFLPEIPEYVNNHYQYLVVGWASDKSIGTSKLRGSYHYVE